MNAAHAHRLVGKLLAQQSPLLLGLILLLGGSGSGSLALTLRCAVRALLSSRFWRFTTLSSSIFGFGPVLALLPPRHMSSTRKWREHEEK